MTVSVINTVKIFGASAWLIAAVLSGLVACKASSPEVVCGEYSADYPIASERLVLFRDGSYSQHVEIKNSTRTATALGRWSYTPDDGFVGFDESFLLTTTEFGDFNHAFDKPRRGRVDLPIERYPLGWRIGSDEGVLYKKMAGCKDK